MFNPVHPPCRTGEGRRNGRAYDYHCRTVHQGGNVPSESLTRRLETGAAFVCGFCRRGRPRGSSFTGCAELGRSGTQKTVTLGSWPAIDVRKAAEEARRLAGEVAAGRDPRANIREEKRRSRSIVSTALNDYEQWAESRRLRKVQTMLSALRRGLSHLLQRDLAELDRRVLIDAIERIERSGRIGAARDFRKTPAHVPQPPAFDRRARRRSSGWISNASRDQGRRARGRGTRKIVE